MRSRPAALTAALLLLPADALLPPIRASFATRPWPALRARSLRIRATDEPEPESAEQLQTRRRAEAVRRDAKDGGSPFSLKKVKLRVNGVGEYEDEMNRPSWERDMRVQWVDSWPVGGPDANPEVGGMQRKIQYARGLRDDVRRKSPLYASDWTDGLKPGGRTKSLAAILFLYFACVAPVLAFGGAMGGLTQGAMGVTEVITSCGLCGMAYAALAGQPMTFVAPTGLTLAFTAALYRFCVGLAIPFLPMYAWVGCWTSLLLIAASVINASGLIRYCTRFTEDVFNALLAFNFLSEAIRSLRSEFTHALSAGDGFLALNVALLTAWLLEGTNAFRSKRYLPEKWREAVSDFGPPAVILAVSAATLLPGVSALGTFTRLSLPGGFQLAGGRALLVPMLSLPVYYRWLALLPALFLATLFFLDQNITVRTVNSPTHKLRKGAAYHLDLLALGVLTGFSSVCGLPWMCSATVQSLNHVRAMTVYERSSGKDGREVEEAKDVIETRLTGFGVHGAILATGLAVPLMSCVPLPVVSGVFLYLGRKVMSGNQFLRRCKQLFLDEKELCPNTAGEKEQVILGRASVFKFTALQVVCLSALWALKLNPSTALIFPSLIGVLMLVRTKLIPRLFSYRELMLLDTAIGATAA